MAIDLEVDEIRDRLLLTEMMHAYCRHADTLDPAGMVALFTEDCVADFVDGDEEHISRSRDDFAAWLETALEGVVTGSHHISNVEILFETPNRATFCCYMYSVQRWEDYPMHADAHRWGRYEIKAVRDGHGWKFAHLRLLSAIEYGGDRTSEQMGRPWPPAFP